MRYKYSGQSQRVQVLNNLVLGFWVIVNIVQVLGKHMIIRYLDPQGVFEFVNKVHKVCSVQRCTPYPAGGCNLALCWGKSCMTLGFRILKQQAETILIGGQNSLMRVYCLK